MTCHEHKKLDAARTHVAAAADLYREVSFALDDEYAFQDPEWQEGAGGQRSVRIGEALRARIEALNALPGVEYLG